MRSKIGFATIIAVLIAALTGCGNADRAKGPQASSGPSVSSGPPTTEQFRAIAEEAHIYGFPMVDSYRVEYSYFIDPNSPEYKGPWNEVRSGARVFTPADTTVQAPNSDTPYSMLGADLRAEPLVLFGPPIEKDRYYALQFIDGYAANFAYVGSRATGSDGGVTMYQLPENLLVDNPINRYVINPPMLPGLVTNPDGSLTFYVQNESPGAEQVAVKVG